MSNMSWAQSQPHQRYSAVPGFERDDSLASVNQVSGPGTPDEKAGALELDNFDPINPPPAHRASLYSDPFNNGGNSPTPSQALLNDTSSMYSNGNSRPSRNQYAQMDSHLGNGAGAVGGAAAGYGGAQYAVGHGTEGATADDLWNMDGGNRPRQYATPEKPSSGGGSKKWIWIGVIALLACIGIGVGVGVGVSQGTKNKSASSSSSSGSGNSSTTTVADGSDPSKFDKDPNLHQVFWGLAYTPKDTIWPNCWANVSTVTKDIQLLSQLTTRLRLYGAMCNTTALVLQAIKDTKVNMTIWPAIYIDSNTTAYEVQVEALKDAFETYGTDNIEGVAVGNEFLLINMTAGGYETEPSGTGYTNAVKYLSQYITDFRTKLDSWNLSKTIPVGTGDAGALMSTTLAQYIDYYMANVHPWFAGTTVQVSANWTYEFFEEWDVAPAEAASNKPETYIAETGWPTGSSPRTSENNDDRSDADATVANLQIFLDTFVCQANANGTKYFYFEPFDEEWKDKEYGGVEGYWGLFDSNRVLKNITIPTCT